MTITNKLKLDVPVDRVFDFLSEFENICLWNYYVLKVWRDKDVDGKFLQQIRKTDQQTFKVVEESKPNKIKIETTNQKGLRFSRIFQIKASSENECILDDHIEMYIGKPQFIQKIFKPQVEKAVGENLYKLKQLLEQGSTVLQDGRKSYLYPN